MKHKKLKALLKAVSSDAIGIKTLKQLKALIDMGDVQKWTRLKLVGSDVVKSQQYEEMRRCQMIKTIKYKTKQTSPVMALSDKGLEAYNAITNGKEKGEVSAILNEVLNDKYNKLAQLVLLIDIDNNSSCVYTYSQGSWLLKEGLVSNTVNGHQLTNKARKLLAKLGEMA